MVKARRGLLTLLMILTFALTACGGSIVGEREILLHKRVAGYPLRFININTGEVQVLPAGERVAVIFWARWCSYSRPFVTSINEKLRETPLQKGKILTISLDAFEDVEKVLYFARTNMTQFVNGFSGNNIYDITYKKLSGAEIPEIHLIDEKGILRGITDSYREMRDFLEG